MDWGGGGRGKEYAWIYKEERDHANAGIDTHVQTDMHTRGERE